VTTLTTAVRYRFGSVTVDAETDLPGREERRVPGGAAGAAHFRVRTDPADAPDGPVILRTGTGGRLRVSAPATGGLVFAVAGYAPWSLAPDGSTLTAHSAGGPLTDGDADVLVAVVVPRALTRRGLLLVHASVVALDGAAVLFCGPSGAGKSTLAAAFARHRGAPLLGDDAAPVDLSGPDVRVWAGDPDLRLWDDSPALAGGWAPGRMARWGTAGKARLVLPAPDARPLPVRAVLRLVPADELSCEPLRPTDAVMAVRGCLLRADRRPAAMAAELAPVADLVERVPVRALGVPRDGGTGLAAVVDLVASAT
jgi:hypothetical protein